MPKSVWKTLWIMNFKRYNRFGIGAVSVNDDALGRIHTVLLMPGGLWYAIHAAPLLEAEYGRPVLLNILSTIWAALHAAGKRMLHRPDPRWGKVLASL